MRKAQVLLFLIIAIRIILCFQPGFKVDIQAWLAWSQRLISLGPENFYDKNIWTNYTPGYLIFLWAIGFIKNNSFFEVILKLFTNFFDIATAGLIFLIIKKHKDNFSAKLGSLLYLANPAIIFNSSVWGQIDGILTFFILLSFYLTNEIKNIGLAIPVFFASILIKPQALLYLPTHIQLILTNFSIKKFFAGFLLTFLLLLLTNSLFFPKNIFGLPQLILQMLNDYPFTSLYAFNFWALVSWWESDTTLLYGLSLSAWGLILFILSLLLIFLPLNKKNSFKTYFSLSLITLAFFLFPTRIHERYLFPFFAFFTVTFMLKKSIKLIIIYIFTSFIHLYNLWYVYANFANNSFLTNSYYLFSLSLLIIFIILVKDFKTYDTKS